MNLRSKLVGTAGVAAAALAVGVTPLAVSAQAVAGGVVAFEGTTTTLTCQPFVVVIPEVGCPSGGGNFIPLVGGTGTYTFVAPGGPPAGGFCLELDWRITPSGGDITVGGAGGPTPPPCSVTSSGAYVNVVCGTGAVTGGTATVTDTSILTGATSSVTVNILAIPFVAGVGVVLGTATDNSGDFGPAVGVVDISPPPGVNLPPVCVTNFDVLGVATFSGVTA